MGKPCQPSKPTPADNDRALSSTRNHMETSQTTWFCDVYELLIQLVSNSGVIVLLPLTLDRYLAVVYPIRHRYIMTKRVCRGLSLASWLPILGVLVKDVVSYSFLQSMKVGFQCNTCK